MYAFMCGILYQEDASHVGALCNYGLLKQNVYRDAVAAEALYRKALVLRNMCALHV